MASWYGPEFHGNLTSSKEIFNMYELTAAHRTLPFGTYLMVTNLKNGKSVKVRINDRGPFVENRIIDLSYAAASLLDIVEKGLAPVKIEVLTDLSEQDLNQRFSIQVGSFIYKKNATDLIRKLQKKFKSVYISRFETPNETYYRVRIKAVDRSTSLKIAKILSEQGHKVLVLEND